jgi:hypothetical protein
MDALIIVFASGLISLFAAFYKKPLLVLSTALGGLMLGIASLIHQLSGGQSLIKLGYEGLEFTQASLYYSLTIVVFAFLLIGIGYSRFKESTEHILQQVQLS